MQTLKMLLTAAMAFAGHAAIADPGPSDGPSPLGDLQSQVDTLAARITALENSAPTPAVDGRSYCMMVTVTILRGIASTGLEVVETPVVRRIATFAGGTFSATVVSNEVNALTGTGVIENLPGIAPLELSGTYTQVGRQLDVLLTTGASGSWYVSGDGSVIHNNSIEFLGPFPNSLTIGIVRSATFVESATCEGA